MENEQKKLAIITGADGGMGTEITRAVAKAGYRVIMASCRPQRAEVVRDTLLKEQTGLQIEIRKLDLASLSSVADFSNMLLMSSSTLYSFFLQSVISRSASFTFADSVSISAFPLSISETIFRNFSIASLYDSVVVSIIIF